MNEPVIKAAFLPTRFPLDTRFSAPHWRAAPPLVIDRDWRGEAAPPELSTVARVVRTQDELVFGFECGYTELDVDAEFDAAEERYALWDRDVCEAFVRSPLEPAEHVYKEFEVAPTGQWCDLRVDRAQGLKDWEWRSGLRTASEISEAEGVWRVAMAIPFAAFGVTPQAGDEWRANLFRISRLGGERQYLTLSPTHTERPNFHVPAAFVGLRFD
jgi:alpha-galactosidase